MILGLDHKGKEHVQARMLTFICLWRLDLFLIRKYALRELTVGVRRMVKLKESARKLERQTKILMRYFYAISGEGPGKVTAGQHGSRKQGFKNIQSAVLKDNKEEKRLSRENVQ